MKPKEFDELIRQKFDRNDFAYDPENWDRLAEKLDGTAKKRSMMIWWWVPLAGMAASVALAFGVSFLLQRATEGNTAGNMAYIQNGNIAQPGARSYVQATNSNELSHPDLRRSASVNDIHTSAARPHKVMACGKHFTRKDGETGPEDQFGISLKNATGHIVVWHAKKIDLTKETAAALNKNKQVAVNEAITTFKPIAEKMMRTPVLSIILSGGVNHGNLNSGYVAGATIRRMISDKVYVESDIAFASSNNTQSTSYVERQVPVSGAKHTGGAKMTSTTENNTTQPLATRDIIAQKDISYDLYYAQITPGIGYKLIRKMSIGVGPDFQRMLVDNRPTPSSVDRGNIQVAPLFDVGFVGKTEYALTKKVRAAVYYRKGVNNIITPMDKYIDRDYLQFQVKYTIFNK